MPPNIPLFFLQLSNCHHFFFNRLHDLHILFHGVIEGLEDLELHVQQLFVQLNYSLLLFVHLLGM